MDSRVSTRKSSRERRESDGAGRIPRVQGGGATRGPRARRPRGRRAAQARRRGGVGGAGPGLLREGHHELSAEALQRAVLLDPRSAGSWYRLSVVRSQLEQPKEALAAARRAAALDPDSPILLTNLGRQLVRDGRHREARPYLEEAVRRLPGDADASGLLGIALFRSDDFAGAVGCLEETLRREPDSPVLWAYLGVSLDETGRREAAVWALETSVFTATDWGWAWGRLGKARRGLGRHDEAVEAFEKSVAHGFAPPVLWSDMGHSAAELRDVARVARACRELGRLDAPDLARALRARLRRLRAAAREAAPEPASGGAPPLRPRIRAYT